MLFYYFIKKNTNALHAPVNNINDKKAFPRASFSGLMTLEAAIVLPIFILFFSSLIYLINIITLQMSIEISMEEACRQVSHEIYLYESFSDLSALEKLNLSVKDDDLFSLAASKTISILLLKEAFLNEDLENAINSSYIINGIDGINYLNSFISSDNENIKFSIDYKISIPFLPHLFTLKFRQECDFHPFTGEPLLNDKTSPQSYVYITVNATVYHSNPFCSYLISSAGLYSKDYLNNMLEDKNSFTPCPNCAPNGIMPDKVLLCVQSHVFHTRIDCFYLTKDIYKVTLSSVEGKELCERCQKGLDN